MNFTYFHVIRLQIKNYTDTTAGKEGSTEWRKSIAKITPKGVDGLKKEVHFGVILFVLHATRPINITGRIGKDKKKRKLETLSKSPKGKKKEESGEEEGEDKFQNCVIISGFAHLVGGDDQVIKDLLEPHVNPLKLMWNSESEAKAMEAVGGNTSTQIITQNTKGIYFLYSIC